MPRSFLWLALARAGEGVVVVDEHGTLVFANDTWLRWTGCSLEQLQHMRAPFPFWISHHELAALGGQKLGPCLPGTGDTVQTLGSYPFRHAHDGVFWCEVDAVVQEIDGRQLTIGFLRRSLPASVASAANTLPHPALALAEELPFDVVVTDSHGRITWSNNCFRGKTAAPGTMQGSEMKLGVQMLRECFAPASAAMLERLMRDPDMGEKGRIGRLVLQRLTKAGEASYTVAFWLAVPHPHGGGFLFAFPEEWEVPQVPEEVSASSLHHISRTAADGPGLLFRPRKPLESWDKSWEQPDRVVTQGRS